MKGFAMIILLISLSLGSSLLRAQDHRAWDHLLGKYVTPTGKVDYKGFIRDQKLLKDYLDQLGKTSVEKLSAKQQKAFWINAYNAFTVSLILKHYPVKSIMDIKYGDKDAWSYPFIELNGKKYTLNQIEHDILRKQFPDPRIHFAVNCASVSCPKLSNRAFYADNLDGHMDELTRAYLSDQSQNKLTSRSVKISEIFKWYREDFERSGTLIGFLNTYSSANVHNDAAIQYLPYNWDLNGL